MRVGKKGWPDIVKVGYRSPKKIRGIHPSGLKEILIFNSKNLEEIEPTEFAIKIAHTVGVKKKILIREQAEKLGLHVLNPGSGEEY
jgi:large subunit ribosomal protein L32e